MDVPTARPGAALLLTGAALAAGAVAQTPPDEPNQPLPVPGQVLSDIEPLPAEDRASEGAVVIHGAPVRAQREAGAFTAAGEHTGVPSVIGRRVSRVLERARGWDEPREAEVTPNSPADPMLP